MKIEKQLSIFLENKPGVLAEVCKTLATHRVNIRGLSVSDTVDHAVVRLVVDDPRTAIHVLGEYGAMVVETDVLAVELDDVPGALAALASKLARSKTNLEYAYGTSDGSHATVFCRVSDTKKAMEALGIKSARKKKSGS